MDKFIKVSLPNNFPVGNFLVSTEVDYMLSISKGSRKEYMLLNMPSLGLINSSTVESFVNNGKKVFIIDEGSMSMDAYNISEEDLTTAMLNTLS